MVPRNNPTRRLDRNVAKNLETLTGRLKLVIFIVCLMGYRLIALVVVRRRFSVRARIGLLGRIVVIVIEE